MDLTLLLSFSRMPFYYYFLYDWHNLYSFYIKLPVDIGALVSSA